MEIDDWFDLVCLIVFLVIGVAGYATLALRCETPIVETVEDKSAVDTKSQIIVDNTIKTGNDLLMSLFIVDEFNPFPKSIRINNTPIIDLNKTWVAKKYENINVIYSNAGEYKLSDMLNWKVKNIEYVENNGDPYIHYVLEEE